jgi:2-iminobutanoate/2-iminopropanoate deaminase
LPVIQHNPPGVFPPYRAYCHATEVRGDARLLVISGLNGYREADPADDEANVRLRMRHLGDHRCASTVVCCRLLEPRWKLELEAMAAT